MSADMAEKSSKPTRKRDEPKYPGPTFWKCPKCDNKTSTEIDLEQPPYCQSRKHKDMCDMVQTKGRVR